MLAKNLLLPEILKNREQQIIERWRMAPNTDAREREWQALRQLEELAGAIEDATREYSGS